MIGIGDKVVCIDDTISTRGIAWALNDLERVVTGEVYTVRAMTMLGTGFLFEEIVNPKLRLSNGMIGEAGFCFRRFRKVFKTDISIFQEIARVSPKKITEKVDA